MGEDGITIVLADDHTMVCEGLAALVAGDPEFRVIGQCGHGRKVLEQVRQLRPRVLVLDITMPGMNGLDLCREVTRKVPSTAVLMLTMHDDEEFVVRALENGASGYLTKEAAAKEFREAVRAVARGQAYLGPGIPRSVLGRVARKEKNPYERLSARERQILQLTAEGKTSRQIAEELALAVKTIDNHRANLMRKLNIHDRTSLVKYALRRGIAKLR